MGVFAAMSISGLAIGLISGGLLTTYLSWRWVLFVNVPIGNLTTLVATRQSPNRRAAGPVRPARRDHHTLGVAALVDGRTSAATSPNGVSHWGDTKVIVSLAASAVLLATFLVIEARSPHALMPLRIFRNRDRSAANLIMRWIGPRCSGCSSPDHHRADGLGRQRAEDRRRLPADSGRHHGDGRGQRRAGGPDRRPAAAARRIGHRSGRHVLAVRISEHSTYTSGLLGPMLNNAAGLGMLFMPLTLVALSRVPDRDAAWRPACQRRPAGRRSIGLALLGTVAWNGVANAARSSAADAASATRAGHPRAGTPRNQGGDLRHALAAGSPRVQVSAGLMLIALIVTNAAIRFKRAALAAPRRPRTARSALARDGASQLIAVRAGAASGDAASRESTPDRTHCNERRKR